MIEQQHDLGNGNILIWLGNQPIQKCEHVLILRGGDVKLLQTAETISGEKLAADLRSLNKAEFLKKYRWPNNSSGDDLYWMLKSRLINVV
jgi:hypothetical protein